MLENFYSKRWWRTVVLCDVFLYCYLFIEYLKEAGVHIQVPHVYVSSYVFPGPKSTFPLLLSCTVTDPPLRGVIVAVIVVSTGTDAVHVYAVLGKCRSRGSPNHEFCSVQVVCCTHVFARVSYKVRVCGTAVGVTFGAMTAGILASV